MEQQRPSHGKGNDESMSKLAREKIPQLSKTRFLAGLQCHKRLYLECFHRDLADPVDVSQQAIFDAGTRVGELARDLYRSGVLVDYDHFHHDEAVASTEAHLYDPSIPAVYEAGFQFGDIRTRVDLITRVGNDQFDMIEVKSTTRVKEEHLPDVAIQIYVLEGSGIALRRACLAHLNKDYVYPGGHYDLNQLFCEDDITEEAHEFRSDIPSALEAMRLALRGLEPPEVKASRHCSQPFTCPFYGYCHLDEPEHHVSQLPRASQKLLLLLEEAGIDDIHNIPAGFSELNELQRRVRDCVVSNRVYIDQDLADTLAELEPPIHFLDFETFNPALPLYVGTRPYQVIPFQWSDHVMDSDGNLRHDAFLHEGFDDPRDPFARSLLKTLGTSGSIVVYSSFEATRIRELADALPNLSGELLALLDERIIDLLPLLRKHCYHPGFHGSFSLKSVLPALVPGFGYGDLEITDGSQASVVYAEMIHADTPSDRRELLKVGLLSYCKRDTEGLVRLLEVLR